MYTNQGIHITIHRPVSYWGGGRGVEVSINGYWSVLWLSGQKTFWTSHSYNGLRGAAHAPLCSQGVVERVVTPVSYLLGSFPHLYPLQSYTPCQIFIVALCACALQPSVSFVTPWMDLWLPDCLPVYNLLNKDFILLNLCVLSIPLHLSLKSVQSHYRTIWPWQTQQRKMLSARVLLDLRREQ